MRTWHIGGSRQKLTQVLSLLANFLIKQDDDYELIFRKCVYKRSQKQNKRLWAILHEIAEALEVRGQKFSADTWHEYFKARFIGNEEIALPNGKILQRPISATTLDKAAFSIYMQEIEAFAAQHGVLLSDPFSEAA